MSLLDRLEELRELERELDEAELERLRAERRIHEASFRREQCRRMIRDDLAELRPIAGKTRLAG